MLPFFLIMGFVIFFVFILPGKLANEAARQRARQNSNAQEVRTPDEIRRIQQQEQQRRAAQQAELKRRLEENARRREQERSMQMQRQPLAAERRPVVAKSDDDCAGGSIHDGYHEGVSTFDPKDSHGPVAVAGKLGKSLAKEDEERKKAQTLAA